MTPWEQAIAVYQSELCFRSFDEDLRLHMRHGFVFSTPEFFIMGRPVVSLAHNDLITDSAHQFPVQDCDCWHVALFAGDIDKAWPVLPWELPLMSFQRRNDLRIVSLAALRRLSRFHP